MKSVYVKTRLTGGGWTARAGRGYAATTATCTVGASEAAQRAAGKYFRIDPCNVVKVEDLIVNEISAKGCGIGEAQFRVDLPDTPPAKGGAS